MMKVFNRKKRIRLTNHLYMLQKFEYNESDYEDGIAEYIEQSKRSLPDKDTVSGAYVYNAKIENPFIYGTGEGFDDSEKCLGAMRAPSTPTATAASSTVAEETSNSRMRPAMPRGSKYALTFSIDILILLLFCWD